MEKNSREPSSVWLPAPSYTQNSPKKIALHPQSLYCYTRTPARCGEHVQWSRSISWRLVIKLRRSICSAANWLRSKTRSMIWNRNWIDCVFSMSATSSMCVPDDSPRPSGQSSYEWSHVCRTTLACGAELQYTSALERSGKLDQGNSTGASTLASHVSSTKRASRLWFTHWLTRVETLLNSKTSCVICSNWSETSSASSTDRRDGEPRARRPHYLIILFKLSNCGSKNLK